jgi:phage baseplate assembly protein V
VGTVTLTLDGQSLAPALAASVSAITVRQVFNAPAVALVTFADPPPRELAPKIGQALQVRAPDGTALIDAEVTAVQVCLDPGNVRSLHVRASDRMHRLRKHQAVRALDGAGLAQLLDQAAIDAGVGSEVIGAAPPARSLTIQGEESTSDLLLSAANQAGRYVCLRDGTLRLMTLAGDGETALTLTAGENLLQARVENSADPMRASTLARGWETGKSELVEKTAGTASQDTIEFRGGDALAAFAGLGKRQLVGRISASGDEALALAQADMDRAEALAATFEGLAEGDAGLRPGRVVSLRGLGDGLDSDYVLTEAEHRFDMVSGYVTRVATTPPELPARRAAPGCATLAKVTNTDDPDKLARVRARLTAYGEVETGWMPVMAIGAGKDKGICVLPEPGDDVLVLLPDGDPARGIVLGGLYGPLTPPGQRPGSGARTFTIRTPAGQVLTLDGVSKTARIETGQGDVFEMGPKGAKLSVKRDLKIEAPGKTITFGAAQIKFETA